MTFALCVLICIFVTFLCRFLPVCCFFFFVRFSKISIIISIREKIFLQEIFFVLFILFSTVFLHRSIILFVPSQFKEKSIVFSSFFVFIFVYCFLFLLLFIVLIFVFIVEVVSSFNH